MNDASAKIVPRMAVWLAVGWIVLIPMLRIRQLGGLSLPALTVILALLFVGMIWLGESSSNGWLARIMLAIALAVACLAFALFLRYPSYWQLRDLFARLVDKLLTFSDGHIIALTTVGIAAILLLTRATLRLLRRDLDLPLRLWLMPGGVVLVAIVAAGGWRDLLPPVLLLLISWSIGQTLLARMVGEEDAVKAGGAIVSICLGAGTVSILWLAVGEAGYFSKFAVALSLALLGLCSWTRLRRIIQLLPEAGRLLSRRLSFEDNFWTIVQAAYLLWFLGFTLLAAYGPDIFSDSSTFHLVIARNFARQQNFQPEATTHYFYEQIPIQTLYAGMTVLSSTIAAKLLHLLMGWLLVAATGMLTRHLAGRAGAGILGSALVAGCSLVWWLCGVGYVDLAVAYYFLATLCAAMGWTETRRMAWMAVAGCCAGIAFSAKLTNLALLPIIGLLILWREYRSPKRVLWATMIFSSVTMLWWGPWLWRSFRLTGNPIFPYGNNLFQSDLVEPVAVFATIHFGLGQSLGHLLALPFNLTFRPEAFIELAELGPHLLGLAPLLLLFFHAHYRTTALKLVGLSLAIYLPLWFYGLSQNLRYLLPVIPLLAALLAVAVSRAEASGKFPRLLIGAVTLGLYLSIMVNALSLHSWWLRGISDSGLPYLTVLGSESTGDYLQRHIPGWNALQYLNRQYGTKAKVLSFKVGNRLYCEAPFYIWWDIHALLPARKEIDRLGQIGKVEKLRRYFQQIGYTHLLVNPEGPPMNWKEEDRPIYLREEILPQLATLEFSDGNVRLYKLLE